MSQEYVKFKKCFTLEEAEEVKFLLEQSGIDVKLIKDLPPDFAGNHINNKPEIHLKQADFEQAQQIIEKDAEKMIESVEEDYYLFDSSDDELQDILSKPYEWNAFDYTLAKKILKDRGQSVDPKKLEKIKEERIEILSQPKSSPILVALGYFCAFCGGLLGILTGYSLWTAKKTLPNGKVIYVYTEENRKHGKQIFYIGLCVTVLALTYRIIDGV
ncbi:Uncharacterised protein [Phocoenobacter uteri]|uniref:DUF2007 domain-containing protein n=1 Tax=Phocoenobacter uteri TaxID=146806 RepID=A0A379C9G1_9PAST|nr:hypothetical protein [Phocoenobacter uteri]MDG6882766.1 hypothetical protein [Phocoenobacter uteri]SUB58933.1 Uncharacterised protein [Phocoenobacter uteri]